MRKILINLKLSFRNNLRGIYMNINIPDFNKMSDDEFDAWFEEELREYAESIIKEIESSDEYKNCKGFSPEAKANLIRRVEELNSGSR